MPFQIVRNDITNMVVDAIVNTANPSPKVGAGTDEAIHSKAGPELLAARQRIGPIAPGYAAVTPAYRLKAKYVIHTVGPVWLGGDRGEEELLRRCYENALRLAQQWQCTSIAFPLISTGTYGFPKDLALQIAISAFSAFLLRQEMDIYLVVYDREAYRLSENLFQNVAAYIDENYVDIHASEKRRERRVRDMEILCDCVPMAAQTLSQSLEDYLKNADTGFSEAVLNLIDKSGKKDSEVYKKANLSKQHFSKIRNNPHYKPNKQTAIALAIALELDLEKTRDLIGRAGYALSNSSKFDLIIRYFIEQGNYNVVEINIALYEFDQSLLGA